MNEQTIDLLSDLAHQFKSCLRDAIRLGDAELAPFQAEALAFIARNPGQGQHALAERSGRDKAQVARVIRELETRRLVVRRPDTADGRAVRMDLTRKGASIYESLSAERAEIAAAMLRNVTPQEGKVLLQVLQKMRSGLAELRARPRI